MCSSRMSWLRARAGSSTSWPSKRKRAKLGRSEWAIRGMAGLSLSSGSGAVGGVAYQVDEIGLVAQFENSFCVDGVSVTLGEFLVLGFSVRD